MTKLTHASFFSGVGGLDMGLERAGWKTLSFSEIDPYASAVLARHWPEVPNLGDIVALRDAEIAAWRAAGNGDVGGWGLDDRPQTRDEAGRLDGSGDSGGRDLPRLAGADGDRGGDGNPGVQPDRRDEVAGRIDGPESVAEGGERGRHRLGTRSSDSGGDRDERGTDNRAAFSSGNGGAASGLRDGRGVTGGEGVAGGRAADGSDREPDGHSSRGEHPGTGRRGTGGSGADGTGTVAQGRGRREQPGADGADRADAGDRERGRAVRAENIRAGIINGRELDGTHDRNKLASRQRVQVVSSDGDDWHDALLWTGGFPCQDLSVAGKRAGLAGERSGLAFAFLDLVESALAAGPGRGPRILLFENVPGLLSSNGGRDMAALCGALVDLGFGWAFRVLNAAQFGVPQRRKRVFLVAVRGDRDDPELRVAAERAAAILSVGTSCERHPAAGGKARKGTADRFADGVGGAGALPQAVTSKWYRGTSGPAGDEHHNLLVANSVSASSGHHGHSSPRGDGSDNLVVGASETPYPGGNREVDGVSGRLDDRAGVAIPISGDALRGEGTAATPSPDAEGRVRLRDPGLGVGDNGDPAFTVSATSPGAVAVHPGMDLSPTLTSPVVAEGGRRDKVPVVAVGALTAFSLTPESGQGADLRAVEIDQSTSVVKGYEKSTDRGTFVVDAFTQNQRGELRDLSGVAGSLSAETGSQQQTFVKVSRAHGPDGDGERWAPEDTSPTLNRFDSGETRAVTLVAETGVVTSLSSSFGGAGADAAHAQAGWLIPAEDKSDEDDLLPEGLDSHRYRCCGNGVVTPVAQWIGLRLAQFVRELDEEVREVADAAAERRFLQPINPDPLTAFAKSEKKGKR